MLPVMASEIPASPVSLPNSGRLHLAHSLRVAWTIGRFTVEAVVWLLFVAILVVVCAIDGVNRFGDWSDE